MGFTEDESMSSSLDEINSQRAEIIAGRLLQQNYSVFDLESILEDGVWVVKAKTSSFNQRDKQVRIDARTGEIISVA
jgi:uncharacterized membrane protein YkoI